MKTSTSDEDKRELQRRVEEAEGWIQHRKEEVNQQESEATRDEERLGVLKKEGGCRTWNVVISVWKFLYLS